MPRCPEHVRGEARLEWHRTGKRLVAERRMAHVFKAAFAAYCVSWGRWVEAERELQKSGAVVMTPNKFPVQSPWLAISNRAQQQMMKALAELGISPTSQARVSKIKHGATVTRFEAFLAGKVD